MDIDMDTKNDYVVKEIPVYLSQDMRHLMLLHYPTRLSKYDQLLSSTVTQCKYKTEGEQLEVSYALDTEKNYDKGHGAELAADTDKNTKDKSIYPSGMVDHLSFESYKVSSNTNDMVMYASEKGFHLCPLKSTHNMLPKLNHIDKIETKSVHKKNSLDQNEVSEEEEEESEQIMAKFKDRPGKMSEKKKLQEMIKQKTSEPWINLNFVPNGQHYSRVEIEKFLLPKSNSKIKHLPVKERIKIKKLNPNEKINSIKARQLSFNDMKSYTLENKIKFILFNTKMVSTKVLMDLLHKCGCPTNEEVTTITSHLRKIAVLIHGNWTISSEELYPDKSISSHFGLSFEVMRYLRDYIIHLLNSGKTVNRKDLGKMFNAPPDEVKDALSSVAKLDENKIWKFIITDNDNFLNTESNYKEICKEQKDWWTSRVKQINAWLEHK